jgi:hypothetical protein
VILADQQMEAAAARSLQIDSGSYVSKAAMAHTPQLLLLLEAHPKHSRWLWQQRVSQRS